MLYEPIELVHINVHEKLGRKVAERQTDAVLTLRTKTADYIP